MGWRKLDWLARGQTRESLEILVSPGEGGRPVIVGDGYCLYKSGNSVVLVYPSEYAGTNRATAASWAAGDDFDAIVEDLRAKGVTFEHYDDLPGTERQGDAHIAGEFKAVWFQRPRRQHPQLDQLDHVVTSRQGRELASPEESRGQHRGPRAPTLPADVS
jgi:hypothetical protein